MSLAKFAQALVVIAIITSASPFEAQTYTVLYSFKGGNDGALPMGGLTLDSAGNLYGTSAGTFTLFGGPKAGTTTGSVFMITAAGKFRQLYNFGSGGSGGAWPVAGLVRDSAGSLYGVTAGGGTANQGTVFKLDSHGTFTTLYNFSGGKDGAQPLSRLILDATGNLYGTTYLGGSPGCNLQHDTACGSVFELTAKGKEKVRLRFSSWRKLGDFPYGPLMLDSEGNLFGTASLGGSQEKAVGTVFKLSGKGKTILHTFGMHPDGIPTSGLIEDASGNLYGTNDAGSGDIFKLDLQGNYTILYGFGAHPGDGVDPFLSGVIMDAAGSLYGTTYAGGNLIPCNAYYSGCGVVYKLDASGNETVLYTFSGGMDGANPQRGVIIDAAGNLYGTTVYGGTVNKNCPAGCGVVFKITP